MAIELITGRAGRAHVDSSDVRAFNAYVTAGGRYVLHGGGATIDSANDLRVLPAEILIDGAHVRITGTGEEVTLENGASSYDRIDIVALHYTSVGSEDSRVESVALEVIKGTPVDTGGSAQDPAMPVPGTSILDGSSEVYVPYVRVKITGLVPGDPEDLLPGREQMLKDMIDGLTLPDVSGTLPINKGGTGSTSAADARASLGLGALATLASPLPVANGGTGAANASSARNNLGVPPTSHAVNASTYGLGTGSVYGHVKLDDSDTFASYANSGIAATPAAVKKVRDSLSRLNGKWVSTGITGVTGYRFGNYLLLQIERTGVNVSAGQAITLGTLPFNLRGSKGVAAATTSLGKVGARIFVETDGRVGIAASSAAAISGDNVYGQVSLLLNTVA